MDKERLADRLAAGESIEAIARDVGRHPSTVAYWVGKHCLRSSHADRHAARGGLEREVLAPLVEEGLTIRAIAAKLGVSSATVRHWLGVHGLQTRRATNGQAVRASRRVDEDRVTADCPVHGTTTFVGSAEGGWRCIACRSERVSRRRRAIKTTLVAEAGGSCVLCGYDRCARALGFHHLDPSTKEFGLAFGGRSRSLARSRAGRSGQMRSALLQLPHGGRGRSDRGTLGRCRG